MRVISVVDRVGLVRLCIEGGMNSKVQKKIIFAGKPFRQEDENEVYKILDWFVRGVVWPDHREGRVFIASMILMWVTELLKTNGFDGNPIKAYEPNPAQEAQNKKSMHRLFSMMQAFGANPIT